MRQFRITILWQDTGHVDKIVHVFDDGHSKTITADEFLSLMSACVTNTISTCSVDAQAYFENYLLDGWEFDNISNGLVQSVEEIDA